MKRKLGIITGAAIVVVGLGGCSTQNPAKKMCAGDTCAFFGSGTAKITIDGSDQSITGKIQCETYPEGEVSIMVATPDQGPTRADVDLKGSDVESVFIVVNPQLNYHYHGGGDVKMTKAGNNYSLSGHLEDSNRTARAFTMDVNCS